MADDIPPELPATAYATDVGSDSLLTQTSRDGYHAMVEKAKDYIVAGDVFQVVPSQRFQVPFKLPPFALYRALRRLNPSPFPFSSIFAGFPAGAVSGALEGKMTARSYVASGREASPAASG